MGERIPGVPPEPRNVWVRSIPGKPGPQCYPQNLGVIPDIANDGTYAQALRADVIGAKLSEASAQEIGLAQRLEASGRITQAQADQLIASAIARATTRVDVAARARPDPARLAKGTPARKTQANPNGLPEAELEKLCKPQEGPKIYCNTRWYYGLVDMKGLSDEEIRTKHPHLVKWHNLPGEVCPPGSRWWTRAGAWVVRELVTGLDEAGEGVKALTRRASRRLSYAVQLPALAIQEPGTTAPTTTTPALQAWCRTTWPGGWIELPIGQTPTPPAMWAKVAKVGDRPSPPCFPGV